MASVYAMRLCSNPVTRMRHLRASVFISYSSPTATVLEALTDAPFNFTFPLSHASAAFVLVLNNRIAQRYLSIRSFSFSAIHANSSQQNTYGSKEWSQCLCKNYSAQ